MDASTKGKSKTPKSSGQGTGYQIKTLLDQLSSKDNKNQSDIKKASKSDSSVKRNTVSPGKISAVVGRSQSSRADPSKSRIAVVARSKSKGEKDRNTVCVIPQQKELVKAGSQPSLVAGKNQAKFDFNQLFQKERRKKVRNRSPGASPSTSFSLVLNSDGNVEAKHESVQMVKVFETFVNVPENDNIDFDDESSVTSDLEHSGTYSSNSLSPPELISGKCSSATKVSIDENSVSEYECSNIYVSSETERFHEFDNEDVNVYSSPSIEIKPSNLNTNLSTVDAGNIVINLYPSSDKTQCCNNNSEESYTGNNSLINQDSTENLTPPNICVTVSASGESVASQAGKTSDTVDILNSDKPILNSSQSPLEDQCIDSEVNVSTSICNEKCVIVSHSEDENSEAALENSDSVLIDCEKTYHSTISELIPDPDNIKIVSSSEQYLESSDNTSESINGNLDVLNSENNCIDIVDREIIEANSAVNLIEYRKNTDIESTTNKIENNLSCLDNLCDKVTSSADHGDSDNITILNTDLTCDTLTTSDHHIDTNSEKVTILDHHIDTNPEKVSTSDQYIDTQSEKVTSSDHHIDTNSEKVTSSDHHILTKPEKFTTSGYHVDTNSEKVTSSDHHILTKPEKVTTSDYHVDTNSEKVASSYHHILTKPEKVTTSDHHINTKPEKLTTSDHLIDTTSEKVTTSDHHINTKPEKLTTSDHLIDTASEKVTTSDHHIDTKPEKNTSDHRIYTNSEKVTTLDHHIDTNSENKSISDSISEHINDNSSVSDTLSDSNLYQVTDSDSDQTELVKNTGNCDDFESKFTCPALDNCSDNTNTDGLFIKSIRPAPHSRNKPSDKNSTEIRTSDIIVTHSNNGTVVLGVANIPKQEIQHYTTSTKALASTEHLVELHSDHISHTVLQSVQLRHIKSETTDIIMGNQNTSHYSKTETGPVLPKQKSESKTSRKKPNLRIDLPEELPSLYPESDVTSSPQVVNTSVVSHTIESPRRLYPRSDQTLETIEEVTPIRSAEFRLSNEYMNHFKSLTSPTGNRENSGDGFEDIRDMTLERLAQYLKERSEELLSDRSYLDSDVVKRLKQQNVSTTQVARRSVRKKSASFRLPPSYSTHEFGFIRPKLKLRHNHSLDHMDDYLETCSLGENSLDVWIRKYGGGVGGSSGGIAGGEFAYGDNIDSPTSTVSLGAFNYFNTVSKTGTGPANNEFTAKKFDEMKYWTLQRRSKRATPVTSPRSPAGASMWNQPESLGYSLADSAQEKEELVLQSTILKAQIEAQTGKIQDLESDIAVRRKALVTADQMLDNELISKSTLETHKLDLMAEISNLKLKLASSERERREMQEKFAHGQRRIDELQSRLNDRTIEVTDLRNKLARSHNGVPYTASLERSESLKERTFERERTLDRLRRKHTETHSLQQAVETLMSSNSEKDKHIDELKKLIRRYKKIEEMVLSSQGKKALELLDLPDNFSDTSSTHNSTASSGNENNIKPGSDALDNLEPYHRPHMPYPNATSTPVNMHYNTAPRINGGGPYTPPSVIGLNNNSKTNGHSEGMMKSNSAEDLPPLPMQTPPTVRRRGPQGFGTLPKDARFHSNSLPPPSPHRTTPGQSPIHGPTPTSNYNRWSPASPSNHNNNQYNASYNNSSVFQQSSTMPRNFGGGYEGAGDGTLPRDTSPVITGGKPPSGPGQQPRKRGFSFGKGFFKLRSGRWSTSAPNLAPNSYKGWYSDDECEADADQDEEALKDRMAQEYKQLQAQNVDNAKQKKKTIKNLFGKLKRSNSQELDENMAEFKRGGVVRSTATGRLASGWSRDNPQYDVSEYPFSRWDGDRVATWLHSIGLSMYVGECKRWVRHGDQMLQATAHELEKEMGMKNVLHRKKLQLALQAMGSDTKLGDMDKLDYNWVTRWLDDIGLPQYKDVFSEARIDGRMLHHMTVDDLSVMKITSAMHHLSIKTGIQVLRLNRFNPNCLKRRPVPDEGPLHDCPQEVILWTNHRVMEWLRSIDLSEYAPNLRGSGVHGGLMVLEPRFPAELFAAILSITPTKTLLRRHLTTHFVTLVGNATQMRKREVESQQGYIPLTPGQKIKQVKKGIFSSHRRTRSESEGDYVCPMNEEIPNFNSIHSNGGPARNGTLERTASKTPGSSIDVYSNEICSLTDMLGKERFLTDDDLPTSNV